MRRLVIVIVFVAATSALAFAKPRVAIAPIKGDANGQIGRVLVEALADGAKVTGPREVERAMARLRVAGELDAGDVQRLQDKLGVAVVVQGKLKPVGKRQRLSLTVRGKSVSPSKFTLKFKSATSARFREAARDELMKRIVGDPEAEPAAEATAGESRRERDQATAAAEDEPRRKTKEPEDEPRRQPAEEAAEDEPRRKTKAKLVAADRDDDDGSRKRKRRRERGGDDAEPAIARARTSARAAVRLDAGATYGLRRMTFDATGAMQPPTVSTPAPSLRVEGEAYPVAVASPRSAARGFGIHGEYDKTVGLAIQVPGTTTRASIDQAHLAIGARYRIEVGAASAIYAGASYRRRHTIADRSALATPTQLDMPDVDYSAVAPGIGARVAVTPSVTVFGDGAGLLIMKTGPIQRGDSYGFAKVYGFEGDAGLDLALSRQLVLRFAGEYSQIDFKFKATAGTMAAARGVKAATDRALGVAATLAVVY